MKFDHAQEGFTAEFCNSYVGEDMFDGPSPSPRKIVHFMLLGFESDVLEIQMEESSGLVDYYVIIEAIKSQR